MIREEAKDKTSMYGQMSEAELEEAIKKEQAKITDEYAEDELIGESMMSVMSNERVLNELAQSNPDLLTKIRDFVSRMIADMKAVIDKVSGRNAEAKLMQNNLDKWQQMSDMLDRAVKGINESNVSANNADGRFAIEEYEKGGKKYRYVKADRKVLSGSDPVKWGEQLRDYINNEIRHGKDVTVVSDNGVALTITEDTAGKGAFRNAYEGTDRKYNDVDYALKLRIESHIDEAAIVSRGKGGTEVDTKKHPFAKDGFTYRIAYFLDYDGKYYSFKISIGKNGKINSIYNVNQIKEEGLPKELKGSAIQHNNAGQGIPSSKRKITQEEGVVKQKFSLSEDEQEQVNQSMTMEQAKRMLEKTFVKYDIKRFNGYKNVDEWIANEDSQTIALDVESDYDIYNQYLSKLSDLGDTFTTDDIIDAYRNGTLTGKQNKRAAIDTSKEVLVADSRFYAPQMVENAKTLIPVADQRITEPWKNSKRVRTRRQQRRSAKRQTGCRNCLTRRTSRAWTKRDSLTDLQK